MQTLENKIITPVEGVRLNNIELEGALLLEILEGVSTHAGRDKSLPVLNSVEVEGGGGLFIARATDRYRLIEGGARALEGSLDKSLISLEDTKRIITLIKAHKDHRIIVNRVSNTLTVFAGLDALTFTLVEGTFPPTGELFTKGEGEPSAIEGVAFNPALMADYAKIAGKRNAIKVYFNGENKPMRVRITSDTISWRALLMPMKYTD
jgi:hypothetical protein